MRACSVETRMNHIHPTVTLALKPPPQVGPEGARGCTPGKLLLGTLLPEVKEEFWGSWALVLHSVLEGCCLAEARFRTSSRRAQYFLEAEAMACASEQ